MRLPKSATLLAWLLPLALYPGFAIPSGNHPDAGKSESVESQAEGMVIDSIVIDNRNIYDTDDAAFSGLIFRLANKLHYRTRKSVIRRELLFDKGDVYSRELTEESSRNLRSRLVLYDAWIEKQILPDNRLLLRVVTIDQWSLAGGLNVNRDGNETTYNLGIRDKNFVGGNQFVSLYYYSESDGDDYLEGSFVDLRFFGRPCRVNLDYRGNPSDKYRRVVYGRPYYNLGQKFSYRLSVTETSGRREVYRDDVNIGASFYEGDLASATTSYRFGSYDKKLQIETLYRYRFEQMSGYTIFSETAEDSTLALAGFPADSICHQLGVGASLSGFDYAMFRQVDGFGFTEDFVLGRFVRLSYSRAFNPEFDDHEFDAASVELSRYYAYKSNLVFIDYDRTFWFRGRENLRRRTYVSGKYYNRAHDLLTIAVRVAYSSDWRQKDVNSLALGGTTGIRGFERFFRTGDRRLVFNLEGRFYPDWKILSVRLGNVIFTDMGNIWKRGQPLGFRGFDVSVGMGLRLAFEKSSRSIVRIDLAYSGRNGWQLSIGTGQYFPAQPPRLSLTNP